MVNIQYSESQESDTIDEVSQKSVIGLLLFNIKFLETSAQVHCITMRSFAAVVKLLKKIIKLSIDWAKSKNISIKQWQN